MRLTALRRPLVVSAASLLAVSVLLAGFAWWLTATDAGFRRLLQLTDRIPGLSIAATGVRGTPAAGLSVAHLVIDQERVRIEISDLRLRLNPLPLVGAIVDADYLTARDVRVLLKPRVHPPDNTPTTFLPAWLHIVARQVTLASLQISEPASELYAARNVRAQLRVSATRVRVIRLAGSTDSYSVTGEATLLAGDPVGVDASLQVAVPLEAGALTAGAAVGGNLERLTVTADSIRPKGLRVVGAIDLHDVVTVSGLATVHAENLAPLAAGAPLGVVDGRLDLGYRQGDFTARGDIAASALPVGALAVDLAGRYAGHEIVLSALRLTAAGLTGTVGGHATFGLSAPHPLAADIDWQDLGWPLRGRQTVVSPGGSLVLRGTPAAFDYTVKGELRGAALPPASIEGRGTVSAKGLEVTDATARLLGGEVRARGAVDFDSAQKWTVAASGRRLNPASLRPRLAGRIDIDARASGRGFAASGEWRASLDRLGGSVGGHPVSGGGEAAMKGGELTVDHGRLDIASLHASANGHLGRSSSIALSVRLGNLGDFVTDAAGSATLSGALGRGPGGDSLRGELAGRGLRIAGNRIGSLTAHADLDSARATDSVLKFEARELALGATAVDAVTLEAGGVAAGHRVELRLAAGDRQASLGGDGTYAAGIEVLHVDAATVRGPNIPAFTLENPTQLTFAAGTVGLEHACLRSGAARLCAVGDWSAAAPWSATAYALAVPIEALPLPLPATAAFLGNLTLSATVHGEPGQPPIGEATADLQDVSFRYRVKSGRDTLVRLGTGRVEARASASLMSLNGDVRSSEESFLVFAAHAPREAGTDAGLQPLDGRIRLRTRELNLIPVLIKDLDRMSGLLEADLGLTGTVAAPELDGRVSLSDGELDIYLSNLLLKQVNATATLARNGLDLKASARAGEGTLDVSGNMAWRNGQPLGTLDFSGENLLVANLPEARVVASPKVVLTLADNRLEVRGEVRIPSARIAPKDLSTAVRASPDQVFVGAGAGGAGRTLTVDSVVRLDVGPDVRLSAYGLKGLLQGSVSVTARSDEPVTGTGELEIKDGHYLAYARDLDIERGRLLLRGGPVDNAGLDIRASRKLPGYTAGVNVRGTLQTPQLSFFSDPPLPQSQIASLLIVGQTPDAMQNGSAGNVLAAQGGAMLVADYTHYLGIDQMTIEGDANNGTALVLGKFLSPRLYVSYGISLAEAINTLKLRYTIGDNWVLKTESGLNHSADIQYSFQR